MAVDGRRFTSSKGSDDFHDFPCSPCSKEGKNVAAVKHCTDCDENLCTSCLNDHNKFSAMKGHQILDKVKSSSGQRLQLPSQRCTKHGGRLIDVYCPDHDTVCCSTCIAVEHRFKMNNTLLLSIVLTGVALLLCIVSTAIPYWWSSDNADLGLFRSCITVPIVGNTCVDYSGDVDDWMQAVRAMMILSILALGAAILLSIMFGFIMKEKQFLAILAAFMCFAGAGLAILGVIIYGSKAPLKAFDLVYGDGSLHASFGLAIIAAIAAVVGGLFAFLAKNRNV